MADKKLVTVITAVYNKAQYLQEWAESLAKQTFLDKTEILVIDDGSTDDSVNLINQYAQKYTLPIKLVYNEKNMGLLRTIIKAYRMLDTKYFAVLDADDYYISPKKLENAVTFLDTHDDYSAYAMNYNFVYESKNLQKPLLPDKVLSKTFNNMNEAIFFQTSATTFRNCFTKDFIDYMEKFSAENETEVCRGDSFRNTIAFGFGKMYFENTIGSAWRCDVGMWGTLSELEQDILNMKGHWELFEFYRAQFQDDENSQHMLGSTIHFYMKSLVAVAHMMRDLSFYKFEFKPSFIKNVKKFQGKNDAETMMNCLLHYGRILKDFGVIIK